MQVILSLGKKIIKFKNFSDSAVAIVEMSNSMWAVLVSKNNRIVNSRNFAFNANFEDQIKKSCREYFNYCKQCIADKNYSCLAEYQD